MQEVNYGRDSLAMTTIKTTTTTSTTTITTTANIKRKNVGQSEKIPFDIHSNHSHAKRVRGVAQKYSPTPKLLIHSHTHRERNTKLNF